MTNFIKNNIVYLVILLLLLYKGVLVSFTSNINSLLTKPSNNYQTEINLLKEKNKELLNSLNEVTKLNETINNVYPLTKLSYRIPYSGYDFYITGSSYQVNDLLVNQDGLVGIIKDIKKDYSECTMLPNINNLSIKIGDAFGTISKYQNDYFIASDFSNYDNINLNDKVYTAKIGDVTELVFIGTVAKIDEHDISKTIYIKSNVDFDNINYLYVVS